MQGYKTTEEYREQGGQGRYLLTNDFRLNGYGEIVRDINFRPTDGRLPDQAICRIFSARADAERILAALEQ